MQTYVLDASALMAFFEDRAGAAAVEELLANAAEAKRPLAMSVVNCQCSVRITLLYFS